MSLIRAFAGLRPADSYADAVAAPPYDVLNSDEARLRVVGKPWSFLHISKPEIDLQGVDPHDPQVYLKGRENFQKMMDDQVLVKDSSPHYYLYQLRMGAHRQIGIVAVASVAAYDQNRIKRHEHTRPDKEDDRVRQIDVLNAQTGPVFLTYRNNEQIDQFVNAAIVASPDVDITTDDCIQHSLWLVSESTQIDLITRTFDGMDFLYIADGHHRSAAASRVAAQRKAANASHTGDEAYNYFLAVIFPDSQMQILDYNRVITDLNNLSVEQLLAAIKNKFELTRVDAAVKPIRTGEFGMYLPGAWYRLMIKSEHIPAGDPVDGLDVSLLANTIIEPILGISDPRRDRRIDFVGGIRGLQELERRVDSGDMAVAFSLFPTSLQQLMQVADAGLVMPPKSTWFEPKLADGLVSHLLD